MTTPANALPSIYALPPLNQGGRIARRGFDFQDHVGASFCLDMLLGSSLLEVWFETHDDVTLIWQLATGIVAEFVQVKSEDLESRYSVPVLCERDGGRYGTSLLERSLLQARCHEASLFRLVTLTKVNGDLALLTRPRDCETRQAPALVSLEALVDARLTGVTAANGFCTADWIRRCHWEQRDSTVAIKNANILRLEQVLQQQGETLFPEQRDELYMSLLALVQRASGADLNKDPMVYRVTQAGLGQWLQEKLARYRMQGTHARPQALLDKMQGIPPEYVDGALHARRAYRQHLLENRYSRDPAEMHWEDEVTTQLVAALSRLDEGNGDDGLPFLNRCLAVLSEIRDTWDDAGSRPPMRLVQGFMYDRANRCVHRFYRPTP